MEADVGFANVLDRVEGLLKQFIVYPSDAARKAHTLWIAHTHFMDAWESTPRLGVFSAEPGSGKTRVLELTSLLVPRPVEAVNVTPAYLFRKVGDEAGRPTILFDEIDTVFGPKAKDNEEIRGMLNAGHRRSGMAGRCVIKGNKQVTEEIPAYCAVALAGLGTVPDTILSRTIAIRMRRRSPEEAVTPFRRRVHGPDAEALRDELAAWGEYLGPSMDGIWPEMPDGIVDRDADVWEPLLACADRAGGDWPELARVAAVTLVTDSKRKAPSLGLRLLTDLRKVFEGHEQLPTITILEDLQALEESPWSDLRGKPLDARGLSRMLGDYDISSTTIRMKTKTLKGYRREDLHDAWHRYLPALSSDKSETSVTAETGQGHRSADWMPGDD